MNTVETVKQIEQDFIEQNWPFADVTFPEQQLLEELPWNTFEGKLRFISAFCTFDYNRNADQLVDNLIELWEVEPHYFEPGAVPSVEQEDELAEVFEVIGFRYPSRDAHAWCANNEIIRNSYNSGWTELLLTAGCDAIDLIDQLKEDDFLCLKGVKIAPMYARFINDNVCELSNLWELDIPVDTHIRSLSHKLFAEGINDDVIRNEWRGLAIEEDISRQVVDGALWQIGNNWDDWGNEYWENVT